MVRNTQQIAGVHFFKLVVSLQLSRPAQDTTPPGYRVFSHDVTAATATGPVGFEPFSYANAFFCSNKFA